MSRGTWNLDHGPLRGLYRDRENGWIFGVCAGIADFGNFRTATVRVIAVVCLLLFFWTGLGAAFWWALQVHHPDVVEKADDLLHGRKPRKKRRH